MHSVREKMLCDARLEFPFEGDFKMTTEQWVTASQIAQGVGSILTVFITLYVAIAVQTYTKRKDRLEIIRHKWSEQQAINMEMLSAKENLIAFEKMVYGPDHKPDEEQSRNFFLLFLMLNGLQHFFSTYKNGLISYGDLVNYAYPTAKLLKNQSDTVDYLLRERGYSEEFSSFMKHLIADACPANPLERIC
jgi:hypothetical protein